jgi:hypothetical protein
MSHCCNKHMKEDNYDFLCLCTLASNRSVFYIYQCCSCVQSLYDQNICYLSRNTHFSVKVNSQVNKGLFFHRVVSVYTGQSATNQSLPKRNYSTHHLYVYIIFYVNRTGSRRYANCLCTAIFTVITILACLWPHSWVETCCHCKNIVT